MIAIKSPDDIGLLTGGKNQILGTFPTLLKSEIRFHGNNNILYCEPGCTLSNSVLSFTGDNSVIFLRKNEHKYLLSVSVPYDSVFYMGENNYINGKMTVILSEQRHCFIGNDGVFSWGICIRNADPHLIYDCETKQRINPTKSVYIGDHVWLGQDCLILKGTEIDSGSIIGAMSVVAGKKVPHNTAWAGNPARMIAENVFWDGACVHSWLEDMTRRSHEYKEYLAFFHQQDQINKWIYNYDTLATLPYSVLENKLNESKGSESRIAVLLNLTNSKNRFVHK